MIRYTNRGISLIETAIVLGLVGIVIGGIWIAATSVMQQYKYNKIYQGFAVIESNVQRLLTQSMPCGNGNYLYYTAPNLWSLLWPNEWKETNANAADMMAGPSLEVMCPATGGKYLKLIFWDNKPYICKNIITKLIASDASNPNISVAIAGADCEHLWGGIWHMDITIPNQ